MENQEPSIHKVRCPTPEALGLGLANPRRDQLAKHGLEDRQWQTEPGDMFQGGVSAQDLDHGPMENRRRDERAIAPGMPCGSTVGMDRFGVETLRRHLAEIP